MSYKYRDRETFTVPAAAGQYAPERITFAPPTDIVPLDLAGVSLLAESGVADAVAEVWVGRNLAVGPYADGDFVYSGTGLTGLGHQLFNFAQVPAVQIRVRSGGTAGSQVISANAD